MKATSRRVMKDGRCADPGSVLLEHGGWVVEPCRGCMLPGYLIVRPAIPARSLSEIPDCGSAELGPLLQRVVRAIEAAVRPARVYVLSFGEQTQDLHFHVFPRTTALTREYLREFPEHRSLISGPLLFDWARTHYRARPASERASEAVRVVAEHLRRDR